MLTKAFSADADDGDETSNTANPVESIDRQSFKSKHSLNVILANIYLQNRTDAVKMVAGSQDMSISSLSSAKKERIEKGSHRPKTNTHATGC